LADQNKDNISEACGRYGEKRNAYRVLVGKPEGRSRYKGWIIKEE
jgi:hypothetical protein